MIEWFIKEKNKVAETTTDTAVESAGPVFNLEMAQSRVQHFYDELAGKRLLPVFQPWQTVSALNGRTESKSLPSINNVGMPRWLHLDEVRTVLDQKNQLTPEAQQAVQRAAHGIDACQTKYRYRAAEFTFVYFLLLDKVLPQFSTEHVPADKTAMVTTLIESTSKVIQEYREKNPYQIEKIPAQDNIQSELFYAAAFEVMFADQALVTLLDAKQKLPKIYPTIAAYLLEQRMAIGLQKSDILGAVALLAENSVSLADNRGCFETSIKALLAAVGSSNQLEVGKGVVVKSVPQELQALSQEERESLLASLRQVKVRCEDVIAKMGEVARNSKAESDIDLYEEEPVKKLLRDLGLSEHTTRFGLLMNVEQITRVIKVYSALFEQQNLF